MLGLTQEQLLQYLTMDLAGTPPVDSFYSARRQMNIDHRIGGNPELSDQTAWLNTLSKNPALLKIYSHVIWADVAKKTGVVSDLVVANLRQAITSRMAAREAVSLKFTVNCPIIALFQLRPTPDFNLWLELFKTPCRKLFMH